MKQENLLKKIIDEINSNIEKKIAMDDITKLEKMSPDDSIDYLIVHLTDLMVTNLLTEDKFVDVFELIKDLDKEKYPTIKELSDRLKWLDTMDLKYIEIGLQESHRLILKLFDELNDLLNKNDVDFYHTGGILAYLLTNNPLERYHHDIDIFINEKNIPQLIAAMKESNFRYVTKRGKRTDDTQRLVVKLFYEKNISIPISVFLFEKLEDGSIVEKDYYYDENNDLWVEERINTPECSRLSFGQQIHYHNDIPYKAITLEALYVCKQGKRPKDIYDRDIMEQYIDRDAEKKILTTMGTENRCYQISQNALAKVLVKK